MKLKNDLMGALGLTEADIPAVAWAMIAVRERFRGVEMDTCAVLALAGAEVKRQKRDKRCAGSRAGKVQP